MFNLQVKLFCWDGMGCSSMSVLFLGMSCTVMSGMLKNSGNVQKALLREINVFDGCLTSAAGLFAGLDKCFKTF